MPRPDQSSQTQMILRHMELYGSITPREALDLYGCFRLAARIHDLRKAGHDIACKDEDGHGRYSIRKPVQTELQLS